MTPWAPFLQNTYGRLFLVQKNAARNLSRTNCHKLSRVYNPVNNLWLLLYANIVNGLKVEADMVLNASTFVVYIPANIYLFKVNNRHTRRRCKKMFKVNNKDTRALSMTSFLCFYLLPLNKLFHIFF